MSECENGKCENPDLDYGFSHDAVMKRLQFGRDSIKNVKDTVDQKLKSKKQMKLKPSGKLDTQLFPDRTPLYHE